MTDILIIGDDLTGANATGALYAQAGLRTLTVSSFEGLETLPVPCDALVINTDSRHLSAPVASARVNRLLQGLGPLLRPRLLVKRVDTTLRGNVGAEAAAVLDWARSGNFQHRVVAVVVPAFPSSNRTTVGGMQLLNGVPLHRTSVAEDPFAPVKYSGVESIIRQQVDRKCSVISLDDMGNDPTALAEQILAAAAVVDFVILDAIEDSDIERIAEACVVASDRLDFVVVDFGPFGAALAKALHFGRPASQPESPILVLCGSATQITDDQMVHLEHHFSSCVVRCGPNDDVKAIVEQLARGHASGAEVIGVRVTHPQEPPKDEDATRVLNLLAELASEIVNRFELGGIYATGGDVARAVFSALHIRTLEIEEQILPLAVLGVAADGPNCGLALITKGGLIGDETAATLCVGALKRRANKEKMRNTTQIRPAAELERFIGRS